MTYELLTPHGIIDPLDSPNLAQWFEKHEVVQDYDRHKTLDPVRWKFIREIALARDNHECAFPGEYHAKRLQVHHLEPLHAGGDPYSLWGLAVLCTIHHALMHPGLKEAYELFRKGDKEAFKKFALEEHARTVYIPPPEAHLVKGIVIERMRICHGVREVHQRQGGFWTPCWESQQSKAGGCCRLCFEGGVK